MWETPILWDVVRDGVKRVLGRCAAEVTYYIGHWSWLLFDKLYSDEQYMKDEALPKHQEWLWNIYQHTMCWSVDVQDWGGAQKPWMTVDGDHCDV